MVFVLLVNVSYQLKKLYLIFKADQTIENVSFLLINLMQRFRLGLDSFREVGNKRSRHGTTFEIRVRYNDNTCT